MARMAIDDQFLRDPRVARLAARYGWSVRETRGALLDVFAICYDRETALLQADDIDTAAGPAGFAESMITVGLAKTSANRILISGAAKRIQYLKDKSDAGRRGGLKSAETRTNQSKHLVKHQLLLAQASRNPPDPVPDLLPDPVPDPVPDQEIQSVVAARPSPRGKSPATPAELAIVMRVLAKLGEYSGVSYGGAAAHVKLITGRLRDGIGEWQLRAVVAFCADEWKGDDKMRKYLRPETLFGPESIAKYLDAACTRYRDLIAKHAPQPTLSLDGGTPR